MDAFNEITSSISKSTASENTREAWLLNAVEKLKPLFKMQGYDVPQVQVSCGFTSSGKNRHAGECWSTTATKAVINEIYISPKYEDAVEVMDILVHELVHAVDNCEHKHGAEFKKIALAVGLEGKMRSASAGVKLKNELVEIAKSLNPYPHVKLNIPTIIRIYKPRPKARCSECGYEIGIFKKWQHLGAPICPVHKIEMLPIGHWEVD
jgi:hypothetical protein